MAFKTLQLITLALCCYITKIYAADSEYWQAFERQHKRTGITVMQHIEALSTLSDYDSITVRNQKKEALAYFFATGGKYGFRKQPPTASEYNTLVEALTIATAIHYSADNTTELDLIEIRRRYGIRAEDSLIQNHLIQAQTIISYTLCINFYHNAIKEKPNLKYDQKVIDTAFAASFLRLTLDKYIKPLEALSTRLTLDYLKSTYLERLNSLLTQIISSTLRLERAEEVNQQVLPKMQDLLPQVFAAESSTKVTGKKLSKVIFSNGRTLERRSDGAICTNLFGFNMINSGVLNFNGIYLDAKWTDEQLITALEDLGIAQVLYS